MILRLHSFYTAGYPAINHQKLLFSTHLLTLKAIYLILFMQLILQFVSTTYIHN